MPRPGLKTFMRFFGWVHAIIAALFACAALALLVVGAGMVWDEVAAGLPQGTAGSLIEAIGVLTAAVVALQISQTITEEEVVRATDVSGPTRVRRFVSRFLVVVVVALAIEGLIATFRAAHDDAAALSHAASLVLALGILLAGWGIFVRMNCAAEELEPEAMREAKREDEKLR